MWAHHAVHGSCAVAALNTHDVHVNVGTNSLEWHVVANLAYLQHENYSTFHGFATSKVLLQLHVHTLYIVIKVLHVNAGISCSIHYNPHTFPFGVAIAISCSLLTQERYHE